MEQAHYESLYYEQKDEYRNGSIYQCVMVSLRRWAGSGNVDCVLEKYWMVDGEPNSAYVVLVGMPTPDMIRLAILTFDGLLESHPVLGKGVE